MFITHIPRALAASWEGGLERTSRLNGSASTTLEYYLKSIPNHLPDYEVGVCRGGREGGGGGMCVCNVYAFMCVCVCKGVRVANSYRAHSKKSNLLH